MNKNKSFVIKIALILLLFGCKKQEKSSVTEIHLSQQILNKYFESDIFQILSPVIVDSLKKPKFYSEKLKRFKGIPNLDSFHLITKNFDKNLLMLDLYSSKTISKEEFLVNTNGVDLDTTNLLASKIKYSFNAISGFKGGKQILIADLNNDFDFSDERVFSFPKDSSITFSDPTLIKNLPVLKFKYQQLVNGKLVWTNQKIKFYPNEDHSFKYLLMKGVINSTHNKYTAEILFQNSWIGKKTIENVPFTISLYGWRMGEYPNIVIMPDSIEHKNFSIYDFKYSLGDTLAVKNGYYKIDSLNQELSGLFFSKIKNQEIHSNGWRTGEKVDNYILRDLNGNEFNLTEKFKKKYLLLDFWGTWCAPCKELTPELKQLYKNNSEKLDILGIAVDKNVENVKTYVSENEMKWYHSFVDSKNHEEPIGKNLKIRAYPTFILLDQEKRIIMRGNTASLGEIKSFLETEK
ncbi:hypothetical protein PK35_02960 [Tamlana nanhaiensis]|uniref:Thioredoxin domain-containing protein n=1 Tax=Neotamlana nanhaiensis TaxID=1382798 RepID=A0A0D7WAF8_9FLAO|nr:TlpA disulfide reductase family protein [Tamlana nanhaiensis]KJD34732.1 hypothetical protein PK35_02960 [Tamlana nanhaiensis]